MKKLLTTSLAASILIAAAACAKDPAQGTTKAEVKAPAPEKAVAPAAEKLTVDAKTSKVAFVGAKVTAQHPGKFDDFKGEIDLVAADPTKSRVTFEVKTSSLKITEESPNEKLEGHLKSPDFFDVEKFPVAKFVSTEIKAGSDVPGMTVTVTGNMTIRDVTKSITFPAKIDVTPAEVSVKTDFAINRKDFGIVYPGKPDDLIKDNVKLEIELQAKRAPGSPS